MVDQGPQYHICLCGVLMCMWKKHLDYRNVHYPGVFQFVIKSVEESIDILYLNVGLHLYRSKPHNIGMMKMDHFCCIFHVQVQSINIQSRTSE